MFYIISELCFTKSGGQRIISCMGTNEAKREMKMKTKKTTVSIEIRERFESTADRPLWRAVVTTAKGRSYSVTYAGDKPSEEKVIQAWGEDRAAFEPYFS